MYDLLIIRIVYGGNNVSGENRFHRIVFFTTLVHTVSIYKSILVEIIHDPCLQF